MLETFTRDNGSLRAELGALRAAELRFEGLLRDIVEAVCTGYRAIESTHAKRYPSYINLMLEDVPFPSGRTISRWISMRQPVTGREVIVRVLKMMLKIKYLESLFHFSILCKCSHCFFRISLFFYFLLSYFEDLNNKKKPFFELLLI